MFTVYFRQFKAPCTRVGQITSHIWKLRHNMADQHGTRFLKILPTSTKGGQHCTDQQSGQHLYNPCRVLINRFSYIFFLCLGRKLEYSSVDQVFCRMCCTKRQTNTVIRALELSFPTTRRISNRPWPVKTVLVMHMTNFKIFVFSVFSFNRLKLVYYPTPLKA